jgi:hypothetical protein
LADSFKSALRRFRQQDREGEAALSESRPPELPNRAATPGAAVPIPPSGAHNVLRFRRTGVGATRCIEVVHARTGTRFVLSREGSAWLLAVDSDNTPHPAELSAVVEMLNETFAARGLGPIDVIVG